MSATTTEAPVETPQTTAEKELSAKEILATLHDIQTKTGYTVGDTRLTGFKAFNAALEDISTELKTKNPARFAELQLEIERNSGVGKKLARHIGGIDRDKAYMISEFATEMGGANIPLLGKALSMLNKLVRVQTLANGMSGGRSQLDLFEKLGQIVEGSDPLLQKLKDNGIDLSKEGFSAAREKAHVLAKHPQVQQVKDTLSGLLQNHIGNSEAVGKAVRAVRDLTSAKVGPGRN